MKRLLSLLTMFTVLILVLVACGSEEATEEPEVVEESRESLEVMVTMFSQYDFAKRIGGEHVNVSRLIPPGVDIHSFEPTAQDIVAINEADLFLYTGGEMELWVHRILESIDSDNLVILDVSQGVNMLPWYGSHDHDHDHDHDDHDDHGHGHDHDHDHDDDHGQGHDHDHGHHHDYDPHIWTSLHNASVMIGNIEENLTTLMPEHADYFSDNAAELVSELEEMDQEFRDLVENAERTTIYHAGRFALHYLMHDYDIDFVAAPMEAEPDTALVARMITEIVEYNIPVIFHEELVNPQNAEMIAAETGAQALLLHSIHNVSVEEIESGETYVSLMRHNLEVLRQALN